MVLLAKFDGPPGAGGEFVSFRRFGVAVNESFCVARDSRTVWPEVRTMNGSSNYQNWSRARSGTLAGLVVLATFSAVAGKKSKFPVEVAPEVLQVGELPKHVITESSGLVVSHQYPGIVWTHNDGTDRRLFAINRHGDQLATFELHTVLVWDWEDLAIDRSNHLFVADIGNNLHIRPHLFVHEIDEPDPARGSGVVKPLRSWQLEFPKRSFDAEGLVIWKDYGYVIEKIGKRKKAPLYRWPLNGDRIATLQEIGKLEVKSRVTGADLSPDGTRLALTSDDGVYLIQFSGGMEHSVKPKPFRVPFKIGQIEGCSFGHDGLLVSSEKREIFLFKSAPFVLPDWK